MVLNLSFSSPRLQRKTLFTTAIYYKNMFDKHLIECKKMRITNGKAAKYRNNALRKPGLCIVIIVLSICVAFEIIQTSLIDLAIKEAATATKRPLSTLHVLGIRIPRRSFSCLKNSAFT